MNKNGTLIEDTKGIMNLFYDHYTTLWGPNYSSFSNLNNSISLSRLSPEI